MIIERNLSKHIVFSEDNLLNALRKISENKSRLVFSVSESGELEGILTDGDFRRWLLEGNQVNLDVPVSAVSNTKYVSLPSDAPMEEIGALFNERIAVVPLLDKRRHLVALLNASLLSSKLATLCSPLTNRRSWWRKLAITIMVESSSLIA